MIAGDAFRFARVFLEESTTKTRSAITAVTFITRDSAHSGYRGIATTGVHFLPFVVSGRTIRKQGCTPKSVLLYTLCGSLTMAFRQGRIPFQKYRAVFWPIDDATGKVDPEWMGFGYCPAIHKSPWEARPYCVPNELIAGRIGLALGLPLPPFGVSASESGRLYYSSLDFNFTANKTRSSPMSVERPPVIPELCAANLGWLCTGVTVFDILIANEERNTGHVVTDNPSDPKWIVAFDHDMSLFGGDPPRPCGVDRLTTVSSGLGVNEGRQRHCFLDVHHAPEHLTDWVKRVFFLPEYLLRDACESAIGVGLKATEAEAAFKFLSDRRANLGTIIADNLHEFPQVKKWTPPFVLF